MGATQVKNGFQGGSTDQLLVNPDGSINVNAVATIPGTVTVDQGTTPWEVAGDVNIAASNGDALVSTDGALNVSIQGLDEFQTSTYTVGLTAIQITPSPLANRSSIGFKAICAVGEIIYIGASNAVTTSTGWPLANGEALQMDLTSGQQIWAIASAAAQNLRVIEIGD